MGSRTLLILSAFLFGGCAISSESRVDTTALRVDESQAIDACIALLRSQYGSDFVDSMCVSSISYAEAEQQWRILLVPHHWTGPGQHVLVCVPASGECWSIAGA